MIKLSNIKKVVSVLVLVPAIMIFAGEAGAEYFGLQLLAGAAIVGVLAWNGAIRRSYDRV
jgi:hypothetical protein